MQVVFDHSEAEAANIRTFYFKPEKPLHYTAGQFIELTVPHENPDKFGQRHWFTLSSSPSDDLLTITTKYAGDEHSSSFKKTLFQIEPDTPLIMSEAMGDFVLPKLLQTPIIFVAGGIGITPMHSMLSWIADTGEERPIKLLYAVRSEEEIVFLDTFEQAGVHATIVVSDPSPAWGGARGRLSAELILGLKEPTDDTLVYVSGPEPMVEALEKDLKKAGLKPNQIVIDAFPNYEGI